MRAPEKGDKSWEAAAGINRREAEASREKRLARNHLTTEYAEYAERKW